MWRSALLMALAVLSLSWACDRDRERVAAVRTLSATPISSSPTASPPPTPAPTPSPTPLPGGTVRLALPLGPGATYYVGQPVSIRSTYTLSPRPLPPGYRTEVRMTILGPDGSSLALQPPAGQTCSDRSLPSPGGAYTVRAELLVCDGQTPAVCRVSAVDQLPLHVVERPAPERAVTGLFTDPRPRAPDRTVTLGPTPDRAFPRWDGASVVLYDTWTGTTIYLSEGASGARDFSPDGTHFAWVAGPGPLVWDSGRQEWVRPDPDANQVRLLDLQTMTSWPLGPGTDVRFIDNKRVAINSEDVIDLRTGGRVAAPPTSPPRPSVDAAGIQRRAPAGDDFLRAAWSDGPYPLFQHEFELVDGRKGQPLLRFQAAAVTAGAPGELLVVTQPEQEDRTRSTLPSGTANLFLIDVASGSATFIASAAYTPPYFPFAANRDYVVWSEGACTDEGRTRLYDRRTGTLTELTPMLEGWFAFTPDGRIEVSLIGRSALFDPAALRYSAVPPGAPLMWWSPDYRYASPGRPAGPFHGNFCY